MVELQLLTDQDRVEAISDWLIELGSALSVSVQDADADTDEEQPIFGEPGMPHAPAGWQRSLLAALYADEDAATTAAAALLADPEHGSCVQLRALQTVDDQDWVRLTQQQFAPVQVNPGFWVVPSWHEAPTDARHLIHLDPGMAFGTGTHPTTRMCLQWIDEQIRAPHQSSIRRALDYGCGSGILAIAAAQRGVGDVVAVDIDPAAVQATNHNAATNQVTLQSGLPDQVTGQFDLVLANILATPLKLLAPLLSGLLRDGGSLVMAGILARQAEELALAYRPWLDVRVNRAQEGWVLMTGTRRHSP